MFENSVEWLMSQVRVSALHGDFLRDGKVAASVTFSGDSALVRDLLNRFAELSEGGQAKRNG